MQPGSLLEGVAGITAVGHKFSWECFPLSIINHRNQSGRVGVLAGGGAEHLTPGGLGEPSAVGSSRPLGRSQRFRAHLSRRDTHHTGR